VRSARGAALAAVLLGGSALLVLATAALAAALVQAQGAAYLARAQQARAAARGGVLVVERTLAATLAREGRLPPAAPPLPSGHGLQLTEVAYRPLGPRAAEVEVTAREAGASVTVGARLRFP
jgi:hypothetical protein